MSAEREEAELEDAALCAWLKLKRDLNDQGHAISHEPIAREFYLTGFYEGSRFTADYFTAIIKKAQRKAKKDEQA